MPTSIELIIDRQLRRWELERRAVAAPGAAVERRPAAQPVITVSRQHGSSGAAIATALAERFNYTLLHRDVIERMCESTGYARRLLESLDERAQSQLTSWFDSMLAGKYVDASDYAVALLKTVHSIAQLGGVVVVGRGANFIVGLERGFHFRVVAPRDARVQGIMKRKGLPEKEAAREVDARDHERADFIRKLFGRSVDDPHAYDLIVNEACMSADSIVGFLAAAAREKFEELRARAATRAG
jgi:cytidylate kinase